MLLQSTIPTPSPKFHNQNHSPLIFNSFSFPSGLLQNRTFSSRQPVVIVTTDETHKSSGFITCSSLSKVHTYGTVDFEKRPMLNWNAMYKKISLMENPELGAASVLNQVENEGKKISKWELCRIVKELRKFRRFKYALQVYEWMNNRREYYRITTSDTAIQLDLMAKVHGISIAEQYFLKLPEALKDKRIYGSLLNAYARARMKKKAEAQMDTMRKRGYASHALPFNVMMTLYMNQKDYEKIESIISEMIERKIALDIYSYNILLTTRGAQGSLEEMEQVFEQMQLDPTINPNWTTFSTMATAYIKLNQFEKADDCLKKIESIITGRDRIPYHYLISLYGSAGKKDEVFRMWNIYKATFANIPNSGYHTLISALVRLEDIDDAEKRYDEWLSVKSAYDPRIANLLLSFYMKKGLSDKARTFFDQMIEAGGKPNSMTWEILAEDHIRKTRIPEALSCLQNAASAEGSKSWRPRPANVASILKILEQESDQPSKDAVFEILRQAGCLDDVTYMSYIPNSGGGTFNGDFADLEDDMVGDDDQVTFPLGQLQESL
ncbi:pentatricopeptide repeat-containing protein [Dorcoceras hygrometricum]|uniref:Pentatricopeptide repeat-containing protein n=1 Tax=Dorcoceras hygrometricum TaxID=472368 RepID=A0A2Z7CFV3_9LAMI|nr:pentatricopeptide repeat-containing protein [Dorcoceras hygrometricum]